MNTYQEQLERLQKSCDSAWENLQAAEAWLKTVNDSKTSTDQQKQVAQYELAEAKQDHYDATEELQDFLRDF